MLSTFLNDVVEREDTINCTSALTISRLGSCINLGSNDLESLKDDICKGFAKGTKKRDSSVVITLAAISLFEENGDDWVNEV